VLTGREDLRFFGEVYGLQGRALDNRVRERLGFVGLIDRADDRVEHCAAHADVDDRRPRWRCPAAFSSRSGWFHSSSARGDSRTRDSQSAPLTLTSAGAGPAGRAGRASIPPILARCATWFCPPWWRSP
jgi:hypothetical protein